MRTVITVNVGLLFLFLIGAGLLDLLRASNALVVFIALIFIFAGTFNAWAVYTLDKRRR